MSFETPLPPYASSDPTATFLNVSCLDLLLIEMVPMSFRVTEELSHPKTINGHDPGGGGGEDRGAGGEKVGAGGKDGGKDGGKGKRDSKGTEGGGVVGGSVDGGMSGRGGSGGGEEDEGRREVVRRRLDAVGYRVGVGVVERFSRDRPRFIDTLDMIKFLCKDIWTLVFRKQIDNLKTNHRGVYVLTDKSFRPLGRMSMANSAEAVTKAQPFLWFPCGVIRGALAAMGLQATVTAESNELPGAVFQIKTVGSKV